MGNIKKGIIVIFGAFVLMCMGNELFAQTIKFKMINKTGFTCNEVFVSACEQGDWGNDILPQDLFENAMTINVTIPEAYGESCCFDMKITDTEDGSVEYTNVDVCELQGKTLEIYEDGTALIK